MRKSILVLALAAILPLFTTAASHARQEDKDVAFKIGNKVNSFKVSEWISGDEVKTLDKSKVYVVDFWSSGAQGCKRSIPMMSQLNDELGPKGLKVVGITSDKADTARDYIRSRGSTMSYSIGLLKEGGGGQSELWAKAAKFGLLPLAGIINREGQICYFGGPFDPEFNRILHLALADRYNTELIKQAEPILGAARRAAKVRNFREASRMFEQVIDLSPKQFADVALEEWRMTLTDAADEAAAKAFIRAYIERIKDDTSTLVFVGNYLATNTHVKTRDLEAATIVADRLKLKASSDADALACIASVQAAKGDFAEAMETQFDAWMAAAPSNKAAYKRALDSYRKGVVAPEPEADPSAAPAEAGKQDAGKQGE